MLRIVLPTDVVANVVSAAYKALGPKGWKTQNWNLLKKGIIGISVDKPSRKVEIVTNTNLVMSITTLTNVNLDHIKDWDGDKTFRMDPVVMNHIRVLSDKGVDCVDLRYHPLTVIYFNEGHDSGTMEMISYNNKTTFKDLKCKLELTHPNTNERWWKMQLMEKLRNVDSMTPHTRSPHGCFINMDTFPAWFYKQTWETRYMKDTPVKWGERTIDPIIAVWESQFDHPQCLQYRFCWYVAEPEYKDINSK